jgi:hypothetical protein
VRFVPGATDTTRLKLGAMLEFLLIGFNIATAVNVADTLDHASGVRQLR